MRPLRIALAQLNVVVGDLDGNVAKILDAMGEAEKRGADLVAFAELAITGYPPEDLLLKPAFVADNKKALQQVVDASRGCAVVVGFVDGEPGALYNAAAVCANGALAGVYHKRLLPNYAVFDEDRYFEPGIEPMELFSVAGVRVGVSICEDAWFFGGPIHELSTGGAELIVNLNGSPFHAGKVAQRDQMLAERAAEASCVIAYVNQVGGQDELVFDGGSLVVGADGEVLTRAPQFRETMFVTDLDVPVKSIEVDRRLPVLDVTPVPGTGRAARVVVVTDAAARLQPAREVYEALVLGTHDYVTKSSFREVVIGLSGGIDSSLVACVAADALGPENVHGVLMPSRFSSEHSLTDAEQLVANLGIDHRVIAIEEAHAAFSNLLAPSFEGRDPDLTEENLQSRIRGVLLMALSNKFGWLVLTTSNKSESAVGYSTLYGDSAGGFAVIKDVPKLLVFELCRQRNQWAIDAGVVPPIPENVLTKPPSAELRPDQRDDQSLPSYEELDPILEAYIEDDKTAGQLIEEGFDPDLVRRIVRLVDVAEYKRRQFPPGVRITTKAFGKDRRLPIVNRYRG
ncbi:MAG: NAD+ synthase [Actinobacteria bacterium]|nr:NAD+ synthase [Actinomycetota bacterium]